MNDVNESETSSLFYNTVPNDSYCFRADLPLEGYV